MKKLILASLALAPLLLTSPAFAGSLTPIGGPVDQKPPSAVPELDAIGAPVALAMIAGLAGIAIERRRRNKK